MKPGAPGRIYWGPLKGFFGLTMFNCKDSIDRLLEYLDGEVPAEVKQHLEEHLDGCAPCEEFLRQYRETAPLCRKALLRSKMPKEVAERLTSFLHESLRKG